MLKFRPGAGAIVAADSQNTLAAVDDALLTGVKMYASVIEATQGSNLPAAQSQELLVSLTGGIQSVVQGRGEIVSAVRHMAAIKARSNFAPENFGCPAGWEELATQGMAEAEPASASVDG